MFSNHRFPVHEHHIHYHYHYPNVQIDQSAYSQVRREFKSFSPRPYQSTIQTNNWKSHINPQISKLYDNLQVQKSRFSDKPDKLFQPTKSQLYTTKQFKSKQNEEDTTFGQMRPLSRLESLYYSKKRKQKYIGQIESVTNQTEQIHNMNEEKLRKYQSEIQRLKKYQEECLYLREHFMLHVEKKHTHKHL